EDRKRWYSEDAERNARALQEKYPGVFDAFATYDELGHHVLADVGKGSKVSRYGQLVCIAFLRRAVMLFTAFRSLVESACVEPSKLISRALLETFFAILHLVHGGPVPQVPLRTAAGEREREKRARYFMTAALRHAIY